MKLDEYSKNWIEKQASKLEGLVWNDWVQWMHHQGYDVKKYRKKAYKVMARRYYEKLKKEAKRTGYRY